MNWAMVLGFAATVVSVVASVPQTYRMIRFKCDPHALLGLSVLTPLMIMTNEVLVFIYGWDMHEVPLWLPQCFSAPFHLFVVLFILRSRFAYKRTHGCAPAAVLPSRVSV